MKPNKITDREGETLDPNKVKESKKITKNEIAPLIPESCSDKLYNCIVKIEIDKIISTGFFMKIKKYNEMHFLITCFHSIPTNCFKNKEIINIYYGKKGKEKSKQIKLDENLRFIKRDKDKDVILIEILKDDNIPNSKYLYPDLNYKNGYDLYKNKNFFLAGYPTKNNDQRCFSSGQIKDVDIETFQFTHSLDTENGSSGSPICLKDGLFVIGIHIASLKENNLKLGVFIGIIIDQLEIKGIETKEFNDNKKNEVKDGNIVFFNSSYYSKFYQGMNNQQYILNEMTVLYDNKKLDKFIRIFGDIFVKNNKNKIKLIINGSEQEIEAIINTGYKRDIVINILEIITITDLSCLFFECSTLKLLLDTSNWNMAKVQNMSLMFASCSSLVSLPDIDKWNTSNVSDMQGMFLGGSSLKDLPDISNWNTSKISIIGGMFRECSSLITLPDISKWDIQNIESLGCLFYECSSLISIPDISKWDTSNVTNMNSIFRGCSSLKSVPDISNWETSKVTDIGCLFNGCVSLLSIPDISKWETNNIVFMDGIFEKCISLKNLPDISKWDISNVEALSCIFSKCCSLESIPNISQWDTSNVKDMNGLFLDCFSLKNLPDISKWEVSSVINMVGIFAECSSLTSIPDISNWNTSKVINMPSLFAKCSSLISIPDISNWNTTNLEDISFMFAECLSLNDISAISKWNLKIGVDVRGIFKGMSVQIIPKNILNAGNKFLHPDALNDCIYPELIRYIFDNKSK